jgi:hypothetical protein
VASVGDGLCAHVADLDAKGRCRLSMLSVVISQALMCPGVCQIWVRADRGCFEISGRCYARQQIHCAWHKALPTAQAPAISELRV